MLTPKQKKQLEDTLNDLASNGATKQQIEDYDKKFREKFDNNENLSTEQKKQLEDTLNNLASNGATMEQIEEYAKKFREKFTKKQSSVYGWDKYPCVVELAKSKGVSLGNSGEYLIGDFKYFASGRKGILSTGKVVYFTCNDPEFKKSSSGSQSSGSQSSGSQSSGSQPVSGGRQSTQIPLELKDIKGVKKFQDWLDVNHPGWHRKYGTLNQNLLRGYGKYGPNTTRGWNRYKDEYLKTSNTDVVSNSQVTSNWMDLFPSCVKGLKSFYSPPQNYFLGFGTDTKGVQYMIAYFSQELNQGRWCNIYKLDGTLVGNGFYSCTTNNQQITIKTLIGLSITGSVINPDSKDIASPKNNDEILEPSDDDVLMDYKTMVSKKTGV